MSQLPIQREGNGVGGAVELQRGSQRSDAKGGKFLYGERAPSYCFRSKCRLPIRLAESRRGSEVDQYKGAEKRRASVVSSVQTAVAFDPQDRRVVEGNEVGRPRQNRRSARDGGSYLLSRRAPVVLPIKIRSFRSDWRLHRRSEVAQLRRSRRVREGSRVFLETPGLVPFISFNDALEPYARRGEKRREVWPRRATSGAGSCNVGRQRDRLMEEIKKSKKMACLEVASAEALQRRSRHLDEGWISVTEPMLENRLMSQNNLYTHGNINGSSHHRCVLQNEIPVDGARVLGIDASSQILIVSGKKPGQDGEHILNKISLLGQREIGQIQLPPNTGAVRDLCILPGSLALIASLGKKLSLLSMFSNNLVLKYDLPVPAWSCSGDVNEPYHIYAGLQNGMLLMFDVRQTAGCLESIEGLSRFPIHSICSLEENHCSRKVLTASSIGPCLWDVGDSRERPFLIPELGSQGICISLACDSSGTDIVTSFRPKMEISRDPMPSQTPASPSQPLHLAGKLGSHVHLKRINGTYFQKGHVVSCYVSEVRMSKSAIICAEGKNPLFACGDESTHGLCLWNLPSFQLHSRYQPHQYPILDIKYSCSVRLGLLGCISENKLQVFSCF